jgi:hypothetical protein
MRPVTTKKTLRLGREPLRVLTADPLVRVAGGMTQDCVNDPEMTTRPPAASGQLGGNGNAGCVGHRPHLADR